LNLKKSSGGAAYTATAFTTAAWDAVSKVEEPKENTEKPTDGTTDDTNTEDKDWAA